MSKIQNIDVRFNATTSNFGKVKAELGQVTAKAAALSATLGSAAFAKNPAVLDPVAWRKTTRDAAAMSSAFRDAASHSGLLTTQQLRQTSQAEKMTKSLKDQKSSLAQMRKDSGVLREAYRDQLRMRRMMINSVGTDSLGRTVTDIAVPKNVPKDLDTIRNRVGFLGQATKSAGQQFINMGKNVQWAGRQLTVGFSYPMALFGTAAGVLAFKVEDAFAKINKVYDISEASLNDAVKKEAELYDLREKSMTNARDIAERYGLSIEKTLAVQQELAATGLTLDTGLLESTREVQRISALGDIDPEQTTDMVVALQTAFKIGKEEGTDLTRTLNFMNAASAATSLSLQDIAEATPRAASGMAAVGATAEEMTVLLVSMREAGVNAAEGANALKSAGSRLLNKTITDKASEIYKSYGADIDVTAISEEAGGNVSKFLELLGGKLKENEALVGRLTDKQKASAVAALFGTYQYNRLTAALSNTADAYSGAGNQTQKAMELMGASTEELEKRAREAEESMMNNAAGRFKQTMATLKAEVAEMGKPFLEAATGILGFVGSIVEKFNDLGDGKKTFLMLSAALLGLAGPLIMIGGLVLNLVGHFAKGVGRIATVTTGFKMMTKEEKAAQLVADAVTKSLKQQGQQTDMLRQEVVALAAAYDQAALAATRFTGAKNTGVVSPTGTAGSVSVPGMYAPVVNNTPLPGTTGSGTKAAQTALPSYSSIWSLGNTHTASSGPNPLLMSGFTNASGGVTYSAQSRKTLRDANNTKELKRQQEQQRKSDALRERSAKDRLLVQTAMNKKVAEETARREKAAAAAAKQEAHQNRVNKVQDAMNGKIGATVGALSMAAVGVTLLGVNTNETADAMIKYTMFAGMAMPLVTSLVTGAVAWSKAMWSAAAGAAAARAASAGAAISGAGFGKSLLAAGTSFMTAIGPVGAVVGALTVAGGIAYTIHQKNKKIAEEQRSLVQEQQKAAKHLANSADGVAESLGKAAGAYETLTGGGEGSKEREDYALSRYNYYKNDESGKTDIAGLRDKDGNLLAQDKVLAAVRAKYIDLQVVSGLTMEESRTELEAMLAAAGHNGLKATEIAKGVVDEYGKVSEMDWSEAISNQLKIVNDSVPKMLSGIKERTLGYGGAGGKPQRSYVAQEISEEDKDALRDTAEKAAVIFQHALNSAPTIEDENAIMSQYMDNAVIQWDEGWKKIQAKFSDGENGERLKELFAKYGVDSGKSFADAWNTNEDFKKAMNDVGKNFAGTGYGGIVSAAINSGSTYEQTFISVLSEQSSILEDSINSASAAIASLKQQGYGGTATESLEFLKNHNEAYSKWVMVQQQMGQYVMSGGSTASSTYKDWLNQYDLLEKEVTKAINTINKRFNLKEGVNASQAIEFNLGGVAAAADDAADGAKKLSNALLDASQIELGHEDIINITRDAMKAVQESLAEAEMAALEKVHEKDREELDNTHDKAMDLLDDELEAEAEAFDKRWEKRKELLEKQYDKQIEANDKALEKEKEADKVRQSLYEKEKKRLDDLANRANTNIDFNVALSEGKMDEAAKILNSMSVKDLSSAMDAEQEAAEAKTEAKEKATEAKNKRLEKKKEAEMKNLESQEERMRKHMKSNHDFRKKQLEDLQAAEIKGFEERTKAEKKSMEAAHKTFKSYTAKSKEDLVKWLKDCGIEYKGFGSQLKGMGEDIASNLNAQLKAQIKDAGISLQDDKVWKELGKKGGRKVIRGLGFKGYASFNKFLDEGLPGPETRHEGGVIGTGGGSRKGVAPTYKGLHRSEKMVLAQKGEYMINRKSSSKHRDLLDAINSDSIGEDKIGVGGSGGPSVAGPVPTVMAAAVSAMFRGIQKGFSNAKDKATNRANLKSLLTGSGAASVFGSEQMANAKVISDVGKSMGMSDRDILIGLMTAMQESTLRNLSGGDRDSVGLFQQRPSQGWGSVEQIMNPKYAARKFFEGLMGVSGRQVMSLTAAAQAVQRSAFPDAYAKWEDEARAVMAILGGKSGGGNGQFYYPSDRGKGWRNSHDYGNQIGNPLYAISDGKVEESRAITSGGSAGNGKYDTPYRSYGEVIAIRDANGNLFRYAHLDVNGRYVRKGDTVKGGQLIGRSGNTGNSTGPHTHFDVNGSYDAKQYLQKIGVPLRTGGTIKYDNTIANLHRGETVLTAGLTKKFSDNVASGGSNEYNVNIDLRGAYIRDDVDIKKAVDAAIDAREAKVGRKRVVR